MSFCLSEQINFLKGFLKRIPLKIPLGGNFTEKQPAPENRMQTVSYPNQFVIRADVDGKDVIQPFSETGIPVSQRNAEMISVQKLNELLIIHQDCLVYILVRIISDDYGCAAFYSKEV